MAKYHNQLLESDLDHMVEEIEKFDPNLAFSVVPGSRLHKKFSTRKQRVRMKSNRSSRGEESTWS